MSSVGSVSEFWWFCSERESIRVKRAMGLARPWTNDEILASHKFTNVDRKDDRGTKLLWNLISNFGVEDKVYAILLYRFSGSYNKHITMMEQTDPSKWQNAVCESLKLFNMSAYQANWGRGRGRGMAFLRFVLPVLHKNFMHDLHNLTETITIVQAAELMCDQLSKLGYPRMRFQATESAKDLAEFCSGWIDPNSKCHLGVGAIKGLKYIWPRFSSKFSKDDAMNILLQQCESKYNYSVLEHALCEYSKWKAFKTGARSRNSKVYTQHPDPLPK